MDAHVTNDFADIIALAQDSFENVEYTLDKTAVRSILRLQAQYAAYRIVVTELFSENIRKYSYYVLKGDYVAAGFDNSPDPHVIRLKYGQIGKEHTGECLPHRHLHNKTQLALTDEMTFAMFVTWVKANIVLE